MSAEFGKTRAQVEIDDNLEWTQNFFKVVDLFMVVGYGGSRFYSLELAAWYNTQPVYNDEFTEAYDGKSLYFSANFGLKPTSFLNLTTSLDYTKQSIKATGEKLFEGVLTTTNIHYQISNIKYWQSSCSLSVSVVTCQLRTRASTS